MDNLNAPRIDDRNRTSTILAPRNCSSLWVKYDDLTFEGPSDVNSCGKGPFDHDLSNKKTHNIIIG